MATKPDERIPQAYSSCGEVSGEHVSQKHLTTEAELTALDPQTPGVVVETHVTTTVTVSIPDPVEKTHDGIQEFITETLCETREIVSATVADQITDCTQSHVTVSVRVQIHRDEDFTTSSETEQLDVIRDLITAAPHVATVDNAEIHVPPYCTLPSEK